MSSNKFVSEEYVIIGDMKYLYAGGSITPHGLKKQYFKCEACPGRIHVYEDIRRFQLVEEHTAMICSITHKRYMESYNMAVNDMISIMEPEDPSMFNETFPLDWDDNTGIYESMKKPQAAVKGYIPTPAGKTPPPRRVHFDEAFVETPVPHKKSGIPVPSAPKVRATTNEPALLAKKELPSSSRQEQSKVPKLAKSKQYK